MAWPSPGRKGGRDESAIRQFAGDELTRAKYYDEDKDFLLEFEPHVVHYEVVGQERTT